MNHSQSKEVVFNSKVAEDEDLTPKAKEGTQVDNDASKVIKKETRMDNTVIVEDDQDDIYVEKTPPPIQQMKVNMITNPNSILGLFMIMLIKMVKVM